MSASRRGMRVATALALGARIASAAPPPATETPISDAATDDAAIVPPHLTSAPPIPYPSAATGDAVVVLALTVGANGAVRAVRVLEGSEPFVAAALRVAPEFRFTPGTRGGRTIAATIRFEVTFRAPVVEAEPAATAPAPANAPPSADTGTPVAAPKEEPVEVVVHGRRPPPMAVTMTRAEVRQLPGAFGDPFRAIEAMPGVTPIVSGLPYFYVRGAPPGNVGYFLDGVRVPYLYHVGLGPSVVHPAMIESVDLYPGGYPAPFGRFAGGIVSGTTTAPRDDLHGEGNIRILDVGAMAETGFADGRGTILLGGRYSYTAAIFSLVAKDVALDYRDYQLRATYDLTPADRIGVFAFGSYDLLGQRQPVGLNVLFGSEFHRADVRYDHRLGHGGTIRVAATVGFDQTHVAAQQNVTDQMTGVRMELYQPVSKAVTLRAGTDVVFDTYGTSQAYYADPDDPNAQRINRLFASRTDQAFGAYVEARLDLSPRIEVTPGVRFDVFTSGSSSAPVVDPAGLTSRPSSATAVDPRISARLKLSKHFRLLEAFGLVHQPPSFVVPVPGLTPTGLSAGLQRAVQASVGAEVDLPEQTTVTASVFHNAFYDMTDALATAAAVSGGLLRGLEQRGSGQAVGFELFARRPLTAKLGGFVSYTLSRSLRSLSNATFPSAFDRTHVASAALAYDLGRRWRLGGRLVFYTGVPKSEPSRGLIVPPPSLHPDRDPAFFRLDLRLEKRWLVGSRGWLSLVLEVLNATLSKEVIASQTIGPVTIPSIGLEGGF